MGYLKAFGNWYANLLSPCSIRIRPFLRKASFIITLALCSITFLWSVTTLLWSITDFIPFNASVFTVLFYTLVALLICTALLFLLYMITLQFNLELFLAKHWLNNIPHILLFTFFIGHCVVDMIHGRNAFEWDEFHTSSFLTFIGWLFSVGLSAIHAQLLKHHRDNASRYN